MALHGGRPLTSVAPLVTVVALVSSLLLAVALVTFTSSRLMAFLDSLFDVDDLVVVVGVKSVCHKFPRHGGSIMRLVTVYLKQLVNC